MTFLQQCAPRFVSAYRNFSALFIFVTLVVAPQLLQAAAFTPGNLVVYRIGDGTALTSGAATAVFLDEYTTSGTLVQSIALPTTATTTAGAQRALTASNSATSEGLLSRSADGACILLTGYNATAGTASVSGTSSATTARVVGVVSGNGMVDTTTSFNNFSGNNIRSAASTDCTNLWASGANDGVRYVTLGGTTTTQISSTVTNLRQLNIAGGQLYVSTGSGSAVRVGTVGAGTPTLTGQTTTNLPGLPSTTGSPYSFFFADLSASQAGVDTLYIADEGTGAGLGLQKYSLVSGSWVSNGSVSGTGIRGLTGVVSGSNVTLYATTTTSTIVSLTDTSGYNATITGTLTALATPASAGTNRAFRGIAFTPGVPPAVDLSVGVTGPTSAFVAANYNYAVTVTNSGTSAVSNVEVQFTLPAGVAFQSTASSTGGSVTNTAGVLTTAFASIAASSSATLTVTVQAVSTGAVTAPAGAAQVDPANAIVEGNETNNSSTQVVTTNIANPAPIAINAVQGSGTSSPLVGQLVSVEGIVIADYQGANQLNGFFIETPDAEQDSDPLTSEGIFVFTSTTPIAVTVGDRVRVSGTVVEFGNAPNTSTQISSPSVALLSSGNALPTAMTVSLPTAAAGELERYEGMRVVFTQTLTVSSTDNLMRFGEVVLSGTGRLNQPSNVVDPNDDPASGTSSSGASNVAAVTALSNLNARSTVILDDASSVQYPRPISFWDNTQNTLRLGTTVANLTGVLNQAFGSHRVYATTPPAFNYAQRPAGPPNVGGNVKVGSMNVLNYFNGPTFPTARGADSAAELVRQRAKMIAAITGLGADVIGLMEVENDGEGASSGIQDIVDGLNAAQGAGTWAFVSTPAFLRPGTSGVGLDDEIKPAIIYKTALVAPVGAAQIGSSTTFSNARAPLAQAFRVIANSEQFTLVVNHFKSKGGTGTGLDADQGDGQAEFNDRRKQQATALVSFISSLGASRVLSVGDYNSYAEEDPIDILRASGLVTLINGSYSYAFGGQVGALDHALANANLSALVTGADEWHINADEPTNLDYNLENKSPLNCTVSCLSPDYFDGAIPFRASDHDPLLVGLSLKAAQTITFDALMDRFDNAAPFAITASSTSSLVVTFSSLTTTVCTTSGPNGATVTVLTIGTCTIRAEQAGDTNFNAATPVPQSFNVTAAPVACAVGTFSVTGLTPCTPASPGSFVATTGATSQTACPAGSYTDTPGQATCILAPAGSFASGTGNTNVTPCAPGTFSANAGQSACTLASIGFFVATSGATAQTPCPSGTTNTTVGATSCDAQVATPPSAPTALRCTVAATSVTCQFNASLTTGTTIVSGYVLACRNGLSLSQQTVDTSPVVLRGLEAGVVYQCELRALSNAGTSDAARISIATQVVPLSRRAETDFDGNGFATLLLRGSGVSASSVAETNAITKANLVSVLGRWDGAQFTFSQVTDIGLDWATLGAGDVAGIGRSALISRNLVDDVRVDLSLFGGQFGDSKVLRKARTDWIVEAVADLDGDGRADILWRYVKPGTNDSGVIFAWYMAGDNAASLVVDDVKRRGGAPLSWSLLGAIDLNGDGLSDLLWQSPTAELRALLGAAGRTWTNQRISQVPTGYVVQKLGDFSGNRRGDILFKNAAGGVKLWVMNGVAIQADIDLPSVDPTWVFYAAGDFNGDGSTDIVWKRANGMLTVWLMQRATPAQPAIVENAGLAPDGLSVVEP